MVGIESRGCLLIIGRTSLYLLDDYFQRPNGELVNVWEAPAEVGCATISKRRPYTDARCNCPFVQERDAFVIATLSSDASQPSSLISQLEGDAQTRKWCVASLDNSCHFETTSDRDTTSRAGLGRPCERAGRGHGCSDVLGWNSNSKTDRGKLRCRSVLAVTVAHCPFWAIFSCLLVLDKTGTADKVYRQLKVKAPGAVSLAESLRDGISEPMPTSNSSGSLSARLAGAVLGRTTGAGALTQQWQQRRISNFEYLMHINTLAGRTYNDLTQFPVFPWVLADYSSTKLDLSNPATFRKLELPMGAQTPARRREFEERYNQLLEVDMDDAGRPFHYGTQYVAKRFSDLLHGADARLLAVI